MKTTGKIRVLWVASGMAVVATAVAIHRDAAFMAAFSTMWAMLFALGALVRTAAEAMFGRSK